MELADDLDLDFIEDFREFISFFFAPL